MIQPKLSVRPTDCCCVYQSAFVFVTVFHHKKVVKPHNNVGGAKDHITCEMPLIVLLLFFTLFDFACVALLEASAERLHTNARDRAHLTYQYDASSLIFPPIIIFHTFFLPPCLSISSLCGSFTHKTSQSERTHARTHGWRRKQRRQ